jgi:hypothetical protein
VFVVRQTVVGELDDPRGSPQQRRAELGLEGGDPPAQGGLAEAEPARRGGEATGVDHGDEAAQGLQLRKRREEARTLG